MERMLLCQRRHFLSMFIIFEIEKFPGLGGVGAGREEGCLWANAHAPCGRTLAVLFVSSCGFDIDLLENRWICGKWQHLNSSG